MSTRAPKHSRDFVSYVAYGYPKGGTRQSLWRDGQLIVGVDSRTVRVVPHPLLERIFRYVEGAEFAEVAKRSVVPQRRPFGEGVAWFHYAGMDAIPANVPALSAMWIEVNDGAAVIGIPPPRRSRAFITYVATGYFAGNINQTLMRDGRLIMDGKTMRSVSPSLTRRVFEYADSPEFKASAARSVVPKPRCCDIGSSWFGYIGMRATPADVPTLSAMWTEVNDGAVVIGMPPPPQEQRGEAQEAASIGRGITRAKACKILHDKGVRGRPLTEKQRKFFGAICSGQRRRINCDMSQTGPGEEGGELIGKKLTRSKACKLMHENGKEWTPQQLKLFAAVCRGQRPRIGAPLGKNDVDTRMLQALVTAPVAQAMRAAGKSKEERDAMRRWVRGELQRIEDPCAAVTEVRTVAQQKWCVHKM